MALVLELKITYKLAILKAFKIISITRVYRAKFLKVGFIGFVGFPPIYNLFIKESDYFGDS